MNDPQRFKKIRELFEAAKLQSPESLDVFLLMECGGDADLIAEVLKLLAADSQSSSRFGSY